jgi:ABC-2 type transport system permease protein
LRRAARRHEGGCIQVGSRPLFRASGLLGTISRLTPHAHALEGYMRLLAEDAGLMQVLPQVGILLAMAGVFYGVAIWRFKFE